MNLTNAADIWSVIASIVSVILGLVAIALAVYFFVQSRSTEKNVTNSLTKIETQASALEKITSRQMDRLTRIISEQRPAPIEEMLPELISAFTQIPQAIMIQMQQRSPTESGDSQKQELIMFYIAAYFYAAQTNFWSQLYLPEIENFDDNNTWHKAAQRMVDQSLADFNLIDGAISKCDAHDLETNPVNHMLNETREFWRSYIKNSTEVFKLRAKAKG